MNIFVVGAGGWGTALSCLLIRNGHQVSLWAWQEQQVRRMQAAGENEEFLPGVPLPSRLRLTHKLEGLAQAELIVLAVPSAVMSGVAEQMVPWVRPGAVIVNAAKGLVPGSLQPMSQVLARLLPYNPICVLSGPSHAEEVARELPTLVCVAGGEGAACAVVQDAFISPSFRVYTSDDVMGVEVGGAVKNIIALASGILAGLELGDNARAALMTRGLSEMRRLGLALGARAETFAGLTGMGDMIVTCTSLHSRNYRAGLAIGRGRKWRQVLADTHMVVEGVYATECAYELARKLKVEMPITRQVYRILYEDLDPRQAMLELMTRPRTDEK